MTTDSHAQLQALTSRHHPDHPDSRHRVTVWTRTHLPARLLTLLYRVCPPALSALERYASACEEHARAVSALRAAQKAEHAATLAVLAAQRAVLAEERAALQSLQGGALSQIRAVLAAQSPEERAFLELAISAELGVEVLGQITES